MGVIFLQGFQLEFVFEPNEYFSNPVLTKEYEYSFAIDECKPLDYDGPRVVKYKGLVSQEVWKSD